MSLREYRKFSGLGSQACGAPGSGGLLGGGARLAEFVAAEQIQQHLQVHTLRLSWSCGSAYLADTSPNDIVRVELISGGSICSPPIQPWHLPERHLFSTFRPHHLNGQSPTSPAPTPTASRHQRCSKARPRKMPRTSRSLYRAATAPVVNQNTHTAYLDPLVFRLQHPSQAPRCVNPPPRPTVTAPRTFGPRCRRRSRTSKSRH